MPLTFPFPVVCSYQTIRIAQSLDLPEILSAVLVREILESRRRLGLGSRICNEDSASARAFASTGLTTRSFCAKFWGQDSIPMLIRFL
jgi:hypothetical protein